MQLDSDMKVTPRVCSSCGGSGKAGGIGDGPCPGCNGHGFTYHLALDRRAFKMFLGKIKAQGTATSRPPSGDTTC